jgi:HTH-type transcriptional regulator/antitoxin HigA
MTMRTTRNTSRALYGKREDRYLELIRAFPLRPVRTSVELDAAVAVVDSLIDQDELSAPEQDYLDVLSDLIESYEDEAVPMRPVDDADMLWFLIESKDETQATVAKNVGISESTISEVLAGKRKLNRKQIGKLARYFRVEPGTFAFGE